MWSLVGRFCHLRRLRNRWFLHGQGGVWKTKVDRHAYCTLEAKCYINRMGSLDLNIRPVFCLFLLVLFAFSLLKKRQKATHILSLKFSFFYLITMPICSKELSASWEGSATSTCSIVVGSCTGAQKKKQGKQAGSTSIHSSWYNIIRPIRPPRLNRRYVYNKNKKKAHIPTFCH